jgi:nucleoside-diphosphate-sugar epimerase
VADCVIHAAGYGQPGLFLDDKLKTLAINTSATLELSSKLSDNGSFIFISTSELYNGCTSSAHSENEIGRTGPDHPRACYIEGKRAGEAIVHALCEKGISGVSARLALAYGPGVHSTDKRVLNQFIQKALTGTIEMLDDGSANRTYGYISDIIIMLLKLTTNTTSGVYNVGGKSKTSIKQLAVEISKLVGAEVLSPEIDNVMRGAPRAVELNLSKIENEFKLPPIVGLSEGLKNTIEWIKHNA